jgi:hypothetical protein
MLKGAGRTLLVAGLAILLSQVSASAAGAGGADRIVIVADSRQFTGWKAWWANLYNESHLHFALLTVVLIPLLGTILGVLTDFLMARIGINLKSRVLAEH